MEDLIGLDSNILLFALDPTFPEHDQARKAVLALDDWAVNATVVHETYHALVFRRRMSPADSRHKILEFLNDSRTTFVNLTKPVSIFSVSLAADMNLGGRDSLIIACYLRNRITEMYSHDEDLVRLRKISAKGTTLRITDPIR